MTDKRDTVYVDLDVDFIRPEHIQIIQQASRIGDVIVALRTDDTGLARRASDLTFRDRRMVVENIRGVKKVVEQQPDYVTNLRILQPKFFVHGGDWDEGAGASDRGAIESALLEWGGQLLEVEKLADFAPTQGPPELKRTIVTPESRRGKIRELLAQRHFVRLLEAHNGLSGLIVEQTRVQSGDETLEFDGMWGSSLTDSTAKGRPDTACVDLTSRLQTIGQILDVTTKPFVFDGDNGGSIEFFRYMVKTLERLGVSAVIIEDKIGVKRNSMFGGEAVQTQDDIYAFCLKIAEGKRAQVTKEFMVIARIESFISQAGLSDAMKRAEAYIDAGADGIMIHSKLCGGAFDLRWRYRADAHGHGRRPGDLRQPPAARCLPRHGAHGGNHLEARQGERSLRVLHAHSRVDSPDPGVRLARRAEAAVSCDRRRRLPGPVTAAREPLARAMSPTADQADPASPDPTHRPALRSFCGPDFARSIA
jgi:phosphoenolpyruvate phosphomutase